MKKYDYDVPVRKPWVKRWLLRSLKLSIVIGGVGFGYDAFNRFQAYQENIRSLAKSEHGYRCAAALSDDALKDGMNAYETIDISTLGCSVSAPFYVSMSEIRDMRAGKLDFEPWASMFDVRASIGAFIAFFVVALAASGSAISLLAIARWIWGTA